MSETETTDTQEQATIYATLVRGRYYDYNGKVWEEGATTTHKVTETEMKYMVKHAVDSKTVDDHKELIQKFIFSENPPLGEQEETDEEAPAPRIRRRAG